ncbi:hypothetical protein Pcinc_022146 [Petrolisthes cinctipes]|uniref:DUF1279 domain-containing protein n=1 Tax=Petrolisthes cinctipes TaxID=88211 RepID=A0AAE1FFV9_PETCI|nr:hypothetical protein Pcinc_022146 [Petrolisthes cinctipes]
MALVVAKSGRVLNWVRHTHTLAGAEFVEKHQQQQPQQKQMHQAVASHVSPPGALIPMPPNVEELQASEKARFSPRRTRDISSKLNQVGAVFGGGFMSSQGSHSSNFNTTSSPSDSRADVYDAHNAVSLSSVMQSNVPKPFEINGKAPVHLNMPGGQWAQGEKYLSGDLQTCHHSNLTSKKHSGTACPSFPVSLGPVSTPFGSQLMQGRKTWYSRGGGGVGGSSLVWLHTRQLSGPNTVCFPQSNTTPVIIVHNRCLCGSVCSRLMHTCTVLMKDQGNTEAELTSRQKLKRAVKDYGATVIVFHVAISLASLGICYLLVSSGVDMTGIFKTLGINMGKLSEGTTGGEIVTDGRVEPSLNTTREPSETKEESASTDTRGGNTETDIDINTRRAAGAATFVVAYAVHKVFAPARIAITLTSTPFIVRHLRRIGFLKPPKPKTS